MQNKLEGIEKKNNQNENFFFIANGLIMNFDAFHLCFAFSRHSMEMNDMNGKGIVKLTFDINFVR